VGVVSLRRRKRKPVRETDVQSAMPRRIHCDRGCRKRPTGPPVRPARPSPSSGCARPPLV
jgi:hypothetical protein